MSMIDASTVAAGTAYLAANRQLMDDYKPYLFKTTDYGATWTEIDGGIPKNEFTHVIREDPARKGLLYVGTERGVWFSFDDGGHWQPLRRNLPQVPVHDLILKDNDLAIATHGRALWIMDDISPLRQLAANTLAEKGGAHLFNPADAYRVSWHSNRLIENLQKGEDPSTGVGIYYWLADSNQVVTLDVRDSSGAVVNHFTNEQDSVQRVDSLRLDHLKQTRNDSLRKAGVTDTATLNKPFVEPPSDDPKNRLSSPPRLPSKKGLNVFYWDFRYADGATLRDSMYRLGRVPGPVAVPGRYSVALTAGGSTQHASFTVRLDPRIQATGAELAARLAFTRKLNDAATELVDAVNRSFALRQEIDRRLAAVAGPGVTQAASVDAVPLKALRDTLLTWGKQMVPLFYRRNQYAEPYTATILDELQRLGYGDSNSAPNAVELSAAETMITLAHEEVTRFNAALRAQAATVNEQLKTKGQPPLNY
jgi:hypothetical protein